MAIQSNLSALMGKHRWSITYVHEQTGLARNTISNLYNDRATRIDYETLDKLCALFKCEVGDIVRWENDKTASEIIR